MPKGQDNAGKANGKGKAPRPAGGSYGDQQPQYGTSAPDWQEPMPGRDERGDFGAGGEAFGSTSGQGRYGKDHLARQVDTPEHPAWQPFGQPEADHPEEDREEGPRSSPLHRQPGDGDHRTKRRPDETDRSFRTGSVRDADVEEPSEDRRGPAVEPSRSKT